MSTARELLAALRSGGSVHHIGLTTAQTERVTSLLAAGRDADAAALVAELQPAAAEHAPPVPGPRSPRQLLAAAGGLAGVHHLATCLSRLEERPVRPRDVRDRLRNCRGVRKLGGGYAALDTHPSPPLAEWCGGWLAQREDVQIDTLVAAILAAHPHGDAGAVESWIRQRPHPLWVRGDRVGLSARYLRTRSGP